MRNHGTCFELLRLQPHDHVGWVFSGTGELVALASPYLVEGASQGELGLFVCDDPEPALSPAMAELVAQGVLQVAATADVYDADGLVDADRQRDTFAEAVAGARAAGFSGLRVVADNSSMVADPARRLAWNRWEVTADRLMAHESITGLCAFDRDRVDVDVLRHLATLHPLFSADAPVPQFRLFWQDDVLRLQGEIDASAVDQLWTVMQEVPAKTSVVVDLAVASFRSNRAARHLADVAAAGVPVTVTGPAERIEALLPVLAVGQHDRVILVAV